VNNDLAKRLQAALAELRHWANHCLDPANPYLPHLRVAIAALEQGEPELRQLLGAALIRLQELGEKEFHFPVQNSTGQAGRQPERESNAASQEAPAAGPVPVEPEVGELGQPRYDVREAHDYARQMGLPTEFPEVGELVEQINALYAQATPGPWVQEEGNFAAVPYGRIVFEVPCQGANDADLPYLIALHNAWPALRAALSRSGRWVPVSERLPTPDTWVLCHNGTWTGIGMHARLEDDGYMEESERWQDEHYEFIEHLGPKVTHWQPLPAAPQEPKP